MFYLLKIENDIELTPSEGYNTLRPSLSLQTIGTDTNSVYPLGVVIRKSTDGTYDNPTMTL